MSRHEDFRAATADEQDWIVEVDNLEAWPEQKHVINDPLTIAHGGTFGEVRREFTVPRSVSRIRFEGRTAWCDGSIAVSHRRFTLAYWYGIHGEMYRDDVSNFFRLDEGAYDQRFQKFLVQQLVHAGVEVPDATKLVQAAKQRVLARSPEDRNRLAIMARGSSLRCETDIPSAVELALLLGAKSEILGVLSGPCGDGDVANETAFDTTAQVTRINADSRAIYLIPNSVVKLEASSVRASWSLREYSRDGDYIGWGIIGINVSEGESKIDCVGLILEFLGVVPVTGTFEEEREGGA